MNSLRKLLAVIAIAPAGVFTTPAWAQIASQSDVRQVVTIAADSVANRLRESGRAHLYLMPEIACDSMANCAPSTTRLVRDVFAASAIATVVQPSQRWPTLCDNSDEMHASVPTFSADTGVMSVISAHAIGRTARRQGLVHTLVFTLAGSRWSLVSYDTIATELEPLGAVESFRCAWSPEAGAAVSIMDRGIAAARAGSGGAALFIQGEESCPWCRITSTARLRLGGPADMQLPPGGAPVYSNGRGRYFTKNSTGNQVLVFDSEGTLTNILGTPGKLPEDMASVDAIVVDSLDSIYVLDNLRRRILVYDTAFAFSRRISLPWRVDSFMLLRDGRIVTVRTPVNAGDPVTVHRATGEIIRSFGAALDQFSMPCMDCGKPLVALAPSGYRLWLAWSSRYRLEEWDLTGRRVGILENPAKSFVQTGGGLTMFPPNAVTTAPVDSTVQAGLNKLLLTADGSLWVGYRVPDPFTGAVNIVDVLDPVRARLVKSFVGESLQTVVSEGIRAVHRTDEFGFPEVRLERFSVDRRR